MKKIVVRYKISNISGSKWHDRSFIPESKLQMKSSYYEGCYIITLNDVDGKILSRKIFPLCNVLEIREWD